MASTTLGPHRPWRRSRITPASRPSVPLKSFDAVDAVDGLDIRVRDGEILGVTGSDGSGETLLFDLITGFLNPSAGKTLFRGSEITGLRPHLIARRVHQADLSRGIASAAPARVC